MAKRKGSPRKKAPPPAGDTPPTGPLACVSNFLSPLQRRALPAEFGNQLRALGLDVHGPVTAGFFPGGFVHAAPGQPFGAAIVPTMGWGRGATVRVGFLDRRPDVEARVQEYVKHWAAAADLTFSFVTSPSSAQVRITFRQAGFSSLLGREAETVSPGQHTMTLGFRGNEPESEFRRLILHEFGHAIGFMHEHQNPVGGVQWNWPAAIAYYRERLPPGMPDQQIMNQLAALPNSSKYKFSAFDASSIMLYQIPQHIVMPGTWRPEMMNNNTELSASDMAAASELYGSGPGGGGNQSPRSLTVDGTALSDSITRAGEVDRYTFTVRADGVYRIETDGDAIVHVTLADARGTPVPNDDGADSISPGRGVRMPRLLDAGTHMLMVNASEFSPHTRGEYTIRVISM